MKTWACQLVLLSLLTCSQGWAAPTAAPEALFAQGLIELSQNHPAAAYATLERGFATEADASKKASMARLLASANPKLLKRPRQEYARFALLAATDLEAPEKTTLLRIVADALFEAGNVAGAERSYRQALAISQANNAADTEYLTYKFGWTRLSQGQPAEAYKIWTAWLSQTPGATSALRKLLIKDAGRAWAENAMSDHPAELLLALPTTHAEEPSLNEGIVAGVQRSLNSDFTRVARALGGSSHRMAVLEYLLANTELFEVQPCKSLQLIDVSLAKQNESAKRLLLECATAEKHEPLQVAEKYRLAELLLTFEVEGLNRWTKARVLDDAGLKSQACLQYSLTLTWQLKQAELSNVPAIIADVLSACPSIAEMPAPTLTSVSEFFSSPAIAGAAKNSSDRWTKALLGVLRLRQLQPTALQALLANKVLWQSTEIPLLTLELLKTDASAQEAIFKVYCPRPLAAGFVDYFGHRIHTLLSQGKVEPALLELGQYAPLAEIRERWAQRLWAAAFAVAPDQVNAAQLARSYAERLAGAGQFDAEDTRSLALLYARMHDWNAIWSRWKLLSPVVEKNHDLSNLLVNGTLENISTIAAALAAAPHAPALLYLKQLAQLVDDTSLIQHPLARAPAPFRGQVIEKDATALAALRTLEPSYTSVFFKTDRFLKTNLARKIATLKLRLGAARKHSWSSRLFLEAADHSVIKMATALATSIAAIPAANDPATEADLKSLAGIIREWRVLDGKERS